MQLVTMQLVTDTYYWELSNTLWERPKVFARVGTDTSSAEGVHESGDRHLFGIQQDISSVRERLILLGNCFSLF